MDEQELLISVYCQRFELSRITKRMQYNVSVIFIVVPNVHCGNKVR